MVIVWLFVPGKLNPENDEDDDDDDDCSVLVMMWMMTYEMGKINMI